MKHQFLSRIFPVIFVMAFFSGCNLNEDEPPRPVENYLLSYEKNKTYLPVFIQGLLGNLTTQYPGFQNIIDNVEHGVTVYTITYKTSFRGEERTASGLVAVPITKGVAFPLLSFQNGTNTLHSEAPSVNPDNELYLLLEFAASTGFVIAFPDYLGFGASSDMFHPYLDKESTIQTVIDMLRAVNELVANHLDIELDNRLFITGYSQGGWATMHLQKEIEEKYMNEFNLVASACSAGPYDLNFINNYILALENYPMPYFVGYIYNSYMQLGQITTPASKVFNPPYDQRILTLYDGTRSGEEINAQLTTKISELFTADYIQNAKTGQQYTSIVTSMKNNSLNAWQTNIPTHIYHGLNDDFVPAQVSQHIYEDFLAKGVTPATVNYFPIPGAGHQDGIIPAELEALKWFIELKNHN